MASTDWVAIVGAVNGSAALAWAVWQEWAKRRAERAQSLDIQTTRIKGELVVKVCFQPESLHTEYVAKVQMLDQPRARMAGAAILNEKEGSAPFNRAAAVAEGGRSLRHKLGRDFWLHRLGEGFGGSESEYLATRLVIFGQDASTRTAKIRVEIREGARDRRVAHKTLFVSAPL